MAYKLKQDKMYLLMQPWTVEIMKWYNTITIRSPIMLPEVQRNRNIGPSLVTATSIISCLLPAQSRCTDDAFVPNTHCRCALGIPGSWSAHTATQNGLPSSRRKWPLFVEDCRGQYNIRNGRMDIACCSPLFYGVASQNAVICVRFINQRRSLFRRSHARAQCSNA